MAAVRGDVGERRPELDQQERRQEEERRRRRRRRPPRDRATRLRQSRDDRAIASGERKGQEDRCSSGWRTPRRRPRPPRRAAPEPGDAPAPAIECPGTRSRRTQHRERGRHVVLDVVRVPHRERRHGQEAARPARPAARPQTPAADRGTTATVRRHRRRRSARVRRGTRPSGRRRTASGTPGQRRDQADQRGPPAKYPPIQPNST